MSSDVLIGPLAFDFNWDSALGHVGAAVIFGTLGIAMFLVALKLIVKLGPFDVHKEIETDQNTALGIVIGSIMLGLAIIVAAAIQG